MGLCWVSVCVRQSEGLCLSGSSHDTRAQRERAVRLLLGPSCQQFLKEHGEGLHGLTAGNQGPKHIIQGDLLSENIAAVKLEKLEQQSPCTL